jgi:hypothetical protein
MMIYYSKYYFVSVICHPVIILVETFLVERLVTLVFHTLAVCFLSPLFFCQVEIRLSK